VTELLVQIATHPYQVFVSVLAIIAAFGFVRFLWGFSGYILAHGHILHQQKARISMVQGLTLLIAIFVFWEIVRWILSFLT